MIGHDVLHDAMLFLDRSSLVAMSLTSCQCHVAVARLPSNVCLWHVRVVDFSMKQEKFERVPSRHRYLGDYHVLKPLEYTLSVRFDDPKTNAETAVTRVYNDRQTVLEVLKHTLRTVSASLVRLSVNTALFDVSQLEQSDAERLGLVDTLSATTDKASLEPSVFEVSLLVSL